MSHQPNLSSEAASRRRARAVTVGVAVVASASVFAVATGLLGIDVRSPAMGEQPSMDIPPVLVVAASGVAALAGWVLLALLERVIRRARQVWLSVALVVLVVSLGAPLTGTGVTTANRVVLVLLHVVVGTIVIVGLQRRVASGAADRVEQQEVDR